MNKPKLQRPDLFASRRSFKKIRDLALQRGLDAQASDYCPPIAVLIRTKNDKANLQAWLEHLTRARKNYGGRIDLIVVDTESSDGTVSLAKAFGAQVLPVKQADFSYPSTLNAGLALAKKDTVATFITVGHALPVLSNCVYAAVRHFEDPQVVGAFAYTVPHQNASVLERLFFGPKKKQWIPAYAVPRVTAGTLGATNCMIRMEAWRKQPLDLRYAQGGEDTAWARSMIASGHQIMYEPAMAVHHSHGLGPLNFWRQYRHWLEVAEKAIPFDQTATEKRRPDLFSKKNP